MSHRLEEAMSIFLAWQDAVAPVSPEELLAEHAELEDYLRPLVLPDSVATEEAPPPSGAAAREFGEYRIIRELGRGGMGVVYEARQVSLGRPVALKILASHLSHDPATLVRFRREATTAARLQHPGIAQVLEFGAAGTDHFLAMQLVRGASLEAIVKELRGRPLSEASGSSILAAIERNCDPDHSRSAASSDVDSRDAAMTWTGSYVQTVVRIVIQVAETLDYAHGEGVIHRDVKPSNIIVQPNGRAMLVDFGLARETGPSSLTMTGDFAGSPYYVSPEQGSRRSTQLDRRSDAFSLGITLYEALTLQRPFEGASPHEVVDRILHAEPVPPDRWNPALPPDLVAVVLKAIEKPLHRRYQSTAAFAQDLRAFLALKPVTARLPTRVNRLGRWVRREPLKAAVTTLLVVALVLAGYLWSTRGERLAGELAIRQAQIDETLVDAWFAAQNSDTEHAKRGFLAVLELDPGNPRALFGYAWTARLGGAAGQAFLDNHAVPGRGEVAIATMRDRFRAPSEPAARPAEVVDEALRRDGNTLRIFMHAMYRLPRWGVAGDRQVFADCLELLEAAIYNAKTPRFEHYMMMSFVASRLDDHRRAALCADAMMAHWPDYAPSLVTRGVALTFSDPAEAVASLRRAIELRPDFYSAHFNLALALGARGQRAEAVSVAKQAAALRPDQGAAPSLVSMNLSHMAKELRAPADAARRQQLLEEAVVYARKSVAISPDNPQYILQLAAAVERAGDREEPWELVQRVIEIAPRYIRAHRGYLGLARLRGDLAAQRRERQRWAEVNPGGPTAQREWAEFLIRHGAGAADRELAVRVARKAVQLTRGDDPSVFVTLAEALQGVGELQEVEDLLRKAETVPVDDERVRQGLQERIRRLRGG